ncbi:hypothetical protein [Oceanithermus profundus]
MAKDKSAFRLLDDSDLERDLPRSLELVLEAVRGALRAYAEGKLQAPPRFSLDAGRGRLVFTTGAEPEYTRAVGFRVYETYPERTPEHAQLVAVWDSDDGRLLGLVLGHLLGALRTAALNAEAVRLLARVDSRVLGVLGTGFQARYHALAALRVRSFERVFVYSRRPENREAFVRWLGERTEAAVEAADDAEPVVREADVLLEVTNARSPVFDAVWLPAGVHLNTVGPKLESAHSLPPVAATKADLLVSDAPRQLEAYDGYFLPPAVRARVVPLADVLVGRHPGRARAEERTVFLSSGLAGTEPAAARRLLEALA